MNVPTNVKLVKFPELDEIDEAIFEKNIAKFLKKVGVSAGLQLSLKQYKKGGLRAQHELHAKLIVGGVNFFAEYLGWNFLDVVQHVLDTLEKEVKKKESFTK